MKSYRIFSKYEHILVLKRADRKDEIQLKQGEDKIFHSVGEYNMYKKPISAFLASGKLGLEMIDKDAKPQEEVKIDEVQINDAQVEEEVKEAEEAEAKAEEEREEADLAIKLRDMKKEYNKQVRAYKKMPSGEEKKQAKEKIDKMKSEMEEIKSELEG
jgi:hypothetical protein